jgi:hypothetical protein
MPSWLAALSLRFHYGEKRISIDAEICPELRAGLVTAMTWLRHWYYDPAWELVRIEANTRSGLCRLRELQIGPVYSSLGELTRLRPCVPMASTIRLAILVSLGMGSWCLGWRWTIPRCSTMFSNSMAPSPKKQRLISFRLHKCLLGLSCGRCTQRFRSMDVPVSERGVCVDCPCFGQSLHFDLHFFERRHLGYDVDEA